MLDCGHVGNGGNTLSTVSKDDMIHDGPAIDALPCVEGEKIIG